MGERSFFLCQSSGITDGSKQGTLLSCNAFLTTTRTTALQPGCACAIWLPAMGKLTGLMQQVCLILLQGKHPILPPLEQFWEHGAAGVERIGDQDVEEAFSQGPDHSVHRPYGTLHLIFTLSYQFHSERNGEGHKALSKKCVSESTGSKQCLLLYKRTNALILRYLFTWCRRRELNPHGAKHRGILSPLRLPIPPLRHNQLAYPTKGNVCWHFYLYFQPLPKSSLTNCYSLHSHLTQSQRHVRQEGQLLVPSRSRERRRGSPRSWLA